MGSRDGTSSQDPLETSRVNALDSEALHGGRPSTRPVSFQGKGWVSNGNKATTPTDPPLYRTGVPPTNQSKTARRVGFQGTRNHHQATRTGRLETTPVRRPRVGQRAMALSTPTLTPILVPWASPWNYKRGSPGADSGGHQSGNTTLIRSRTSILQTTLVFTPVQARRCKIIQTLSPPLDVGPSLARTKINSCVFLHHHLGKGARIQIHSLV